MILPNARIPVLCLFLSILLTAGCREPVAPGGGNVTATSGVYIVNEGGFGKDNSTLTLYDPKTDAVTQDYFALANPAMRIGDTGNDITVFGGKAFITVTNSQTIEVMTCSTAKSLGRITLPAGSNPRQVIVASDTSGFVTNANSNDVTEFNPTTFAIKRRIPVGPAPEGLAIAGSSLFVANSTYGGFSTGPMGDSVLVLDRITGARVALFSTGRNPVIVRYLSATGKLYVLNYPVYPDSTGGKLAEVNPQNFTVERSWALTNTLDVAFDETNLIAYVVASGGLWKIDLSQAAPMAVLFAAPPTSGAYYSVGVRPDNGDVYAGNAKDYTSAGEVYIFSKSGAKLKTISSGISPGAFGFF